MAATTKAAVSETKNPEKPRETMSLQEKFVKLREAIPSITQRQHSSSVKYKFAKIYDVYELLTPAMNEYGVNFDIVGETATRHAENGDPLYYSNFVQRTRDGDRVVWVYEADLTIRWTNADDPGDKLEVTLHAIGTNDGGPDKAKGSAWTYCLKYYLFEKFGIDQGDDDPDMSNHGSDVPPPAQNQTIVPQSANVNRTRMLSDAQLSRMYRKSEDVGMNQQQINEWIFKKYGQQDPHRLTRQQYDEICKALDAKQGGNANV